MLRLLRHDLCSIMQFGSGAEASADVVAADCQLIRMHHVACAAYDLTYTVSKNVDDEAVLLDAAILCSTGPAFSWRRPGKDPDKESGLLFRFLLPAIMRNGQ